MLEYSTLTKKCRDKAKADKPKKLKKDKLQNPHLIVSTTMKQLSPEQTHTQWYYLSSYWSHLSISSTLQCQNYTLHFFNSEMEEIDLIQLSSCTHSRSWGAASYSSSPGGSCKHWCHSRVYKTSNCSPSLGWEQSPQCQDQGNDTDTQFVSSPPAALSPGTTASSSTSMEHTPCLDFAPMDNGLRWVVELVSLLPFFPNPPLWHWYYHLLSIIIDRSPLRLSCWPTNWPCHSCPVNIDSFCVSKRTIVTHSRAPGTSDLSKPTYSEDSASALDEESEKDDSRRHTSITDLFRTLRVWENLLISPLEDFQSYRWKEWPYPQHFYHST